MTFFRSDLKTPGNFYRELLDAKGGVLRCRLLALAALLERFRRRLPLLLGYGLPLQFRGPVFPAISVVC